MRNQSVNSASAEDHISSLDSPACEFKCEITNSMQLRGEVKAQIVFHSWVKQKLLLLLCCFGLGVKLHNDCYFAVACLPSI